MPEFQLSPGVSLFYRDNDFTDPWRQAEPVLLLHGFPESGLAWNGWVPHLARRFRVVRPDMRGFGRSTPMPVDYPWTVAGVVDDYMRLLEHLDIERFHLVGAKVGGALGLRIAASYPQRVRSLTIVGTTFISGRFPGGRGNSERQAQFEREGLEGWARETMAGRLGSDSSPELLEGWIKLMAATPVSTVLGFSGTKPGVPGIDVSADLPRIACPTLAIITEENDGALVEATRARMKEIPRSELVVLPGDSRHVSASSPDACARATLAFIERAPR